jgi:hypothetical protein
MVDRLTVDSVICLQQWWAYDSSNQYLDREELSSDPVNIRIIPNSSCSNYIRRPTHTRKKHSQLLRIHICNNINLIHTIELF